MQQPIGSSGIYPTVPELSKSEFLVKGCKPDSATHGTKNMIANRLMAVLVDGKKGICRSKTLRETDSRKVSSARFKSLLHDGAELIDTLIEV